MAESGASGPKIPAGNPGAAGTSGAPKAPEASGAGHPEHYELILRARSGDREAFGELVALHQRSVYGLALRLTHDPDDARDLAQEAFVKAWAARARFDPERPFAPWVLTITRRLGVDRLRYRGRWKKTSLPGPETPAAPPAQLIVEADAERALETAQLGEALTSALGTLSEHYRAVIELHHLQGRPVAEIAKILGRPPGTVMTWLYRARASLKERLSQEGITP